jgi:hypothetical protein
LIVGQCGSIGVNETMAVEHDDGAVGGPLVEALREELALQQGRDPDGRPSSPDEHETVGGQATSLSTSREQAREDDRTGALDIVVEARSPVAIAAKDADRVVSLEVLPLDDRCREHPRDGVDERLDDRVVRAASQSLRPVTDVERIVPELGAVGPHVERYRQGPRRIDACGRGIQSQLADRDRHPAGPLIAEAQDAFVVGDDDQADVVTRRSKDVVDPPDIVGRDPDASRAAKDVAELLAREAYGRRVDDRKVFLEILDEESVEERLIAILERRQTNVSLEVIGLAADMLELQPDLVLDRGHARRQQTVQAEGVAFMCCEG